MSDTDSFIEEVTEEVRREKLFGYVKRYGWIGVVVVLLIVGGASWNEWRKAQSETAAQDLGDRILEALSMNDARARSVAIADVQATEPRARAALDMIAAAELASSERSEDAVARLSALSENGEVPELYRQLAGFKALLLQARSLPAADRRAGFENYTVPGNPLRLLAEEQLGLILVELGNGAEAIEQFQSILIDAEATADLQQRAMQVIVALGGEPDLSALTQAQN